MTLELKDALVFFDVVDRRRACVMKRCPKFLVGDHRAAMTKAEVGANSGDELRCTRMEIVLVAPQDVLPQTTQVDCALSTVVGSFLFFQPCSVDQFAHHGSRVFGTCIASTVSPPGRTGRSIGADWGVVRGTSSAGRCSSGS